MGTGEAALSGIKVNNEAGSVQWNMIRNWNFCGKYERLEQVSPMLGGKLRTKQCMIFEESRLSIQEKKFIKDIIIRKNFPNYQ